MTVRVDKWLQVARVFKTRSQGTKACTAGRVQINGQTAKAHKNLVIDDRVEVALRGGRKRILIVKELRDRPLPKKDVPRLFEDQSPPPPELSEIARILRRSPSTREKGAGRPTKKDRRELERLRR